ncbi:EamA family transporter [Shimazuella sp. AN120528]|uniref:DMT family transporter n=1 Tax=Shimazuella soli TaxID=1892854 RepID=UPI001F10CD4B|nr:EamA family transporter [Shimazuella soli]MCH5585553.1 EamA family transporter [Shimazuella soli]
MGSKSNVSKIRGLILVLTAAISWGGSGAVAQYLFQHQGISTEWLTVMRLLLAGILMLLFGYKSAKQRTWEIWKDKRDRLILVLYGVFGMLAVQYTYFKAIYYGNAATATVLQYLAPILVTCYLAIRSKQFPTVKKLFAMSLAVLGAFFLITKGNIHTLSISGGVLFWGLSSAFALAFYTIQPQKLLRKWGSSLIVGWGMVIGGIIFSFAYPPWKFEGQWSYSTSIAFLFITLFGTIIASYCYLQSLKYLSPSESSLLACVEPLSAVVLSVIWLHINFGLAEWIGTLCIMSTIFILSINNEKESQDR